MSYARRTDTGHKAIVQALRKVGCKVSDTSRVGQGFPDLVVRVNACALHGCAHDHGLRRILLMEVKEPKGKLTADQEAFMRDFPETVVVRSVDEALRAVGVRA